MASTDSILNEWQLSTTYILNMIRIANKPLAVNGDLSLSLSLQFDILHPLTSIQCREACRLPVEMQDAQSVLMGHNVIIGGGLTSGDSTAGATVYIYDINRDYWGIHSIAPTYRSALTTYRSQLVLAGGIEVASGRVTNSVRVFENGEWCPSIPAMTVARLGASAVSRGQHLIVAGGDNTVGGYTDIVEVFDGRSWSTAQSLPQRCAFMKSVVYNDVWYVCGGGEQGCEVYSAPLQSIVESTRDTQSTVWTTLPPTPHQYSSIALFGQQLFTIGGGELLSSTSAVHAFSPHSQSWPHVGDLPVAFNSTCSLTLSNGELMTLGGNLGEYRSSDRVFIGQLGGKECANLLTHFWCAQLTKYMMVLCIAVLTLPPSSPALPS